MAMSDDANPIVSLLKERRDEVLAVWASTAVARMHGRMSEAEVLGEVGACTTRWSRGWTAVSWCRPRHPG
jgi:hypothetical protein